MSLVGTVFYVELHGLKVKSEALGHQIALTRGDIIYRIDLPTASDSFEFDRIGPTSIVQEFSDGEIHHSDPDPREHDTTIALVRLKKDLIDVRLLKIHVNVRSALSIESFDHDNRDDMDAYTKLFFRLWYDTLQLARDFSTWANIQLDQYWIEPAGKYPRIVSAGGLVDLEAQRGFGFRIGTTPDFVRFGEEQRAADIAALERIGGSLQDTGSPRTDQIWLAEAWHIVTSLPQWNTAPDRATILAAMSLELRVKHLKRLLRENQEVRGRRGRPRSPHAQYLDVMRANLGRHYDRVLAKRVQQLFNSRHAIVHEGVHLDRATARRHVETARRGFALLDQIEADRKLLLGTIFTLLDELFRERQRTKSRPSRMLGDSRMAGGDQYVS